MANFTFDIHKMTPSITKYNVLSTQMEGLKRKTRLKSTSPVRSWDVEVRGRTNSERDLIIAHWDDHEGTNLPFFWNVPDFFGGETYYVKYLSMDYSNPPGLGNVWDFQISFIEEI